VVAVERTIGYVARIAVADGQRKRGIARALMNAAAEWVRERRCETLELTVFEFNSAALHLYESLGYRTISRRLGLELC